MRAGPRLYDLARRGYRASAQVPVIGPRLVGLRTRLGPRLGRLQAAAAGPKWLADGALDLSGAPAERLATRADVYHAYQIILGRVPDRGSWEHYEMYIGQLRLGDLAADLMLSPEFERRNIYFSLVGAHKDESPVLVSLDGFEMYVLPSDDAIGGVIRATGSWEPYISDQVRRLLQPGMTFFDLGANIGYFSLLAASLVGPSGRVIAFEPGQRNCALIWSSAIRNRFPQIDVYPFAAADTSTTYTFVRRLGSNGMLAEELSSSTQVDVEQLLARTLVRTVVIDDLLPDLDRLDVIKIDVEGAEYRVLLGMEKLLRRHRPVIIAEFSPPMLHGVSEVTGEQFLAWLLGCGYAVSVIDRVSGKLVDCGEDVQKVMAIYENEPARLLDLLARPTT